MKRLTKFILLLLFTPSFVLAATPARVVGITDGDTIKVVVEGEQIKIRLHGTDAPEKGQPFGSVSTQGLGSLLAGREVSFERTDTDRYGRTVALVTADAIDVNRAMVANGWAWTFTRYCTQDFCEEWQRDEQEARDAKKGLWRDPEPVAPWDWRKRGKQEEKIKK